MSQTTENLESSRRKIVYTSNVLNKKFIRHWKKTEYLKRTYWKQNNLFYWCKTLIQPAGICLYFINQVFHRSVWWHVTDYFFLRPNKLFVGLLPLMKSRCIDVLVPAQETENLPFLWQVHPAIKFYNGSKTENASCKWKTHEKHHIKGECPEIIGKILDICHVYKTQM